MAGKRDSADLPISFLLVASILAAATPGRASGESMPIVLGAMADALDLSVASTGLIITMETLFFATVGIIIGPFIGIIRRRAWAIAGVGLYIIGSVVAFMADGVSMIIFAKVLTGLSAGTTAAVSSASFALARDPDRLSGITLISGAVMGGTALFVMPSLVEAYGLPAVFAVHVIYALLVSPFLFALPKAPNEGATLKAAFTRGATTAPTGSLMGPALMLIIAGSLLGLGELGSYSMMERRGQALDLSPIAIGFWMTSHVGFGMIGALVASLVSTRWGRARPFSLGLAAVIAGILLTYNVDAHWAFGTGVAIWSVGYFLMIPYFSGASAVLDPEGRLIAVKGGVMAIGGALGPAAGTAVAAVWGIQGLAIAGSAIILIALLLAGSVMLKMERDA